MKTSTKFVISAITAIVLYTAASFIALFITGQNIDPALTGAYFAFWTVEIVSLASIKKHKIKTKEKGAKERCGLQYLKY